MKKILEIKYLAQSRNGEHYHLQEQLLGAIPAAFATQYNVSGFRDNYAVLFEKEDKAFLESQALADTKLLETKDAVRDERLRYLELMVQTKQLSLTPTEKEAAEKMAFLMKPYKGVSGKPFAENTAMVSDLVKKLQADANTAVVQALGLTEAVAALKTANNDFEETYTHRADEKQVRANLDSLKLIRPEVDEAFRLLSEAINALYLVAEMIEHNSSKASAIGAIIDAANAQILQFSETLSRRGAGAKAKLNPDTPSDINPGESSGGGMDRPDEI